MVEPDLAEDLSFELVGVEIAHLELERVEGDLGPPGLVVGEVELGEVGVVQRRLDVAALLGLEDEELAEEVAGLWVRVGI